MALFLAQCAGGGGSSGGVADVDTNQPPVAIDQDLSTAPNTPKSFELIGTDPDGDALTFNLVSQPVKGVLSGASPDLTYVPSANFQGSDSFTFQVNDGTVDSNVATVSIVVSPWVPPIGIPQPEFGIIESHTMYVGETFDFAGAGLFFRDMILPGGFHLTVHHMAVRHSIFHDRNGGAISMSGEVDNSTDLVHDIVVFDDVWVFPSEFLKWGSHRGA